MHNSRCIPSFNGAKQWRYFVLAIAPHEYLLMLPATPSPLSSNHGIMHDSRCHMANSLPPRTIPLCMIRDDLLSYFLSLNYASCIIQDGTPFEQFLSLDYALCIIQDGRHGYPVFPRANRVGHHGALPFLPSDHACA